MGASDGGVYKLSTITVVFYTNGIVAAYRREFVFIYNPQNEMFRLLGTKRSFSQNETFFFSHPYPALFRLISHF